MKAFKREDFINLPIGTIFSRTDIESSLFYGLFCKTSDSSLVDDDWFEQDLISELGPKGFMGQLDAFDFEKEVIDKFEDFELDLECSGRDGCFEEKDIFIVWDKNDVSKLINYLSESLKTML